MYIYIHDDDDDVKKPPNFPFDFVDLRFVSVKNIKAYREPMTRAAAALFFLRVTTL